MKAHLATVDTYLAWVSEHAAELTRASVRIALELDGNRPAGAIEYAAEHAAEQLEDWTREAVGSEPDERCNNIQAAQAWEQRNDMCRAEVLALLTAAAREHACPSGIVQTLTYGVLPSEDDFDRVFAQACPSGRFAVRNCKRVGNADFTCSELWSELVSAVADFGGSADSESSDEAGYWASSVLTVLGFEWV